MPAYAASTTDQSSPDVSNASLLASVCLVRCAVAGGATKTELLRDLRLIAAPESTPQAWREVADRAIAELVRSGLVVEARGRLKASDTGGVQAQAIVRCPITAKTTWLDLRDGPLMARALGGDPGDKAFVKALANPDDLRAAIVQRAYGLGAGRPMSLPKLRASLAVRALERAFGNQIKSGLGSGSGLAAKPSRVLAGQLSKTPRDYGSDGRLVAALAAEHLATANGEAETLRLALLRRYVVEPTDRNRAALTPAKLDGTGTTTGVPKAPLPKVANDAGRADQRPLPAARPDLAGFVKEVQVAAMRRAEGWPGNRKAFICHVYDELKSTRPSWALTEIEFKAMLAEAHRTGGLVLANADLKDKKFIQEFEKSAIQYKNTVWHFVRVEEK
jgi:hypothetical protein